MKPKISWRWLFCVVCTGGLIGMLIWRQTRENALEVKASQWETHCEIVRSTLETDARALRGGPDRLPYRWTIANLWTETSPPFHSKDLTLECGVPRELIDIADACGSDGRCRSDIALHAARAIERALQ
jgi:hypothetical protein